MLVPAKRSAGRLQTSPIWFLHLILVSTQIWEYWLVDKDSNNGL